MSDIGFGFLDNYSQPGRVHCANVRESFSKSISQYDELVYNSKQKNSFSLKAVTAQSKWLRS